MLKRVTFCHNQVCLKLSPYIFSANCVGESEQRKEGSRPLGPLFSKRMRAERERESKKSSNFLPFFVLCFQIHVVVSHISSNAHGTEPTLVSLDSDSPFVVGINKC